MSSIPKTKQSRSAFTLIEIMIVVAIIGILAAIAIPNFIRSRTITQRNACIANLHEVSAIIDQWALENRKTTGDPVTEADLTGFLKDGALPVCPADGQKITITAVGAKPTCTGGISGHSI